MSNQRLLDIARIAKVSNLTRELAEDINYPILRKLEKRNEYSPFTENIWGVDLVDIQLISSFDKRTCFLLCVIDMDPHGLFN